MAKHVHMLIALESPCQLWLEGNDEGTAWPLLGEVNFCFRGAIAHLTLMNVDVVVHNPQSEEAINRAQADEGGGEVVIFMLS